MEFFGELISSIGGCGEQTKSVKSPDTVHIKDVKALPKRTGLGIIFRISSDGKIKVIGMSPDGPAKMSKKIGNGMVLLCIDGESVEGKQLEAIAPLMVGEVGSTTTLEFASINQEEPVTVELVHGKFPEHEGETCTRNPEHPIGREERYATRGLSKSGKNLRV